MLDSSLSTDHRLMIERVAAPGVEWDTFVRSTDGATFCHLAGWGDLLAATMGHEPVYLVARDDDGGLQALLPMALHRSRIFGSHLVSMPLLNYGGPIGDSSGVTALLDRAVVEAEEAGATLELRARTPVKTALTVVERKVTVVLPLPNDPEELWTAFKSKVRSQIRRPMKEEMEIRFGPEQLDPFYDVYAVNMRDLGTPALPHSLFEGIARTFADELEVAAVYHRGQPVAAGAGFAFNGEFEITWASSLREFNRQAPNMLLYWGFMEEMIRRGTDTFNFGRCTPGEGTHRFKLQWGGHDQPLPWIVWPEEVESARGPGRVTEMASSAWQKLPVPVANMLGPVLARRLPWW